MPQHNDFMDVLSYIVQAIEETEKETAYQEKSYRKGTTDGSTKSATGKPILTDADSLADLEGRPRPDNPSEEATAAQADGSTNKSSVAAISEIIEGTLNKYLETNKFPTSEQVHTLKLLRELQLSLIRDHNG